MGLNNVRLVAFSPTGTTKQVLAAIAEGLGAASVAWLDLTPPAADGLDPVTLTDDVVVIGAPVYAGRIPETAMARLQAVRGEATPAVLVAVYGNRAFEDALLELADWVGAAGFISIAGAAFIGEHSYDTDATPIATGRPDAADREKAVAFGAAVAARLAASERLKQVAMPGGRPYRERHHGEPIAPVTLPERCTLCGLCEDACPTAAITVGEDVVTEAGACIRCCACVKVCPTGARVMTDARILRTARWLAREHGARKEPEVFL
ncbi:MAG: 4Fe-4S binding protein [Anaerolineae bacterium]|nr:4Fe-4S binding protein [Anaerolineae bacterium]